MNKFPEPTTGRTGYLNRDLKTSDHPYIDRDLPKGMAVFEFTGQTFGCITKNGVAVSFEPNSYPFQEIPADSVNWLTNSN